jgi:hypothetical protein
MHALGVIGATQLEVYGAVIGTAAVLLSLSSLGWQIVSARRVRQIRATISLNLASAVEPGTGWIHFLIIEVYNGSDFPIHVTSVGLGSADAHGNPEGELRWPKPPEATLPGTIEPGAVAFTFRDYPFNVDDYGGPDGPKRFAVARLTPLLQITTTPVRPDQIYLHPDIGRYTTALEAAIARRSRDAAARNASPHTSDDAHSKSSN